MGISYVIPAAPLAVYNYFSDKIAERTSQSKKLCNDLISDEDEFLITAHIHTLDRNINVYDLLECLQKTGPSVSYAHGKTVYLVYSNKHKQHLLRSNISGELISALSSEISIDCIKHQICEPYMVETDIIVQPYDMSISTIIKTVSDNKYHGHMYGIDILSQQKLKEIFLILS